MANTTLLDDMRQRNYVLVNLPATIHVPALPGRHDAATLPLADATVDDIAFAILGLQEKSSAIHREMEALRSVYELARKHGAVGADLAFAIIPAKGGSR